jgi:hypothetical protein
MIDIPKTLKKFRDELGRQKVVCESIPQTSTAMHGKWRMTGMVLTVSVDPPNPTPGAIERIENWVWWLQVLGKGRPPTHTEECAILDAAWQAQNYDASRLVAVDRLLLNATLSWSMSNDKDKGLKERVEAIGDAEDKINYAATLLGMEVVECEQK